VKKADLSSHAAVCFFRRRGVEIPEALFLDVSTVCHDHVI